MVKVMVTGAGALLGQGMIRALKASSLAHTLVACDPSPLAAGLYWADAAHLVPMAHDPSYLPRIEALLRQEQPDVVLIGTDVELGLFAAERARLEQTYSTHILVSDARVVAIADDKWLTYQFLREQGFPFPESCLPGDEEALVERVGFPLVVKPRHGARSVGVSVVSDYVSLERALDEGADLIVQDCVATADEEYTAGVLCFDGSCRASIVMRRDLRDGNTYRAYVDAYPDLNRQVCAMAEQLMPYGPANFQFRLNEWGQAVVFEINGRFSGTTPLRAHAGFNEVEMALRYLLEGAPVVQPAVTPLTILRHWSETVVAPGDLIQAPTAS